ncbi:MAG TPA: crosslink repair DNA glycosylase YcaQ family protein, partial [Actinomycetota bacterium]|nr:crosslink repair DNA glycosylase YcaQ family protein [Actinomycetota bacterium]
EQWIGASKVSENQGVDHLIRRYLGAFGPAAMADMVSFTGLPAATLGPRLERLETVRYRDPAGKDLFDLADALLADPDTPAPVRFLPTWDAALLIHCRRAGILPEAYRPRIFSTKNPQSVSTFLVDGRVAGAWRYAEGRVLLEPFETLDRSVRAELEDEGERLAAFMS